MTLAIVKSFGGPTLHKVIHKLSKYAPEILTGVGVVGVVASTILIAKATTELEPIVEKHERKLTQSKQAAELTDVETGLLAFTPAEVRKDVAKVYLETGWDLTKLYGPGISLSIGSIVAILAAHGIMRRRVVTLVGAYKALEGAYAAYRQNVIDELGPDKDRDFRLGYKTEKIEDPETGKKSTVRSLTDPNKIGLYAKWFDEGNIMWNEDPFYNLAFLKNQQNWLNDKLRIQGYLFLSTVYETLGFDIKDYPEAQIVGWTMNPDNGGDLNVDFGLYTPDNRDFINGNARGVLLDFNVDGVIIDKI